MPYSVVLNLKKDDTSIFKVMRMLKVEDPFEKSIHLAVPPGAKYAVQNSPDHGSFLFKFNEYIGWMTIDEIVATTSRRFATESSSYRIKFYLRSEKARGGLVAGIEKAISSPDDYDGKIYLYTDSYGGWTKSTYSLPIRSLSTVFLPEDLKDTISHSIDSFESSREEYLAKEIPRHYGMCLYGPPGTGKSSLILALANHYHKQLYYPDASSLEKGSELTELIQQVKAGSILVLEDFDTISGAKTREDNTKTNNKYILSKFLNVLDGILTPPGLMFIVTSNRLEDLDEALFRPGRVSLLIEMPYLTQDVFMSIVGHFYGPHIDPGLSVEGLNVTPATVTNMFASFFGQPEEGIKNLKRELGIVD